MTPTLVTAAPARLTAVTETTVIGRIAAELGVRDGQVAAAVQLLDGGATVPFIARYRKEATGTLDDAQLRTLEERLRYLRELEERRAAILASITEQGKLTDELAERINAADTKARLEDLYLPYKPKRRTKAQIARENGLEPLADLLLTAPGNDPATAASDYLSDTVPDVQAALDGARTILVERFAEDADLIGALRERMWSQGVLRAQVREGKEDEGRKYSDYFDFAEPFGKLKAHRVLAMFRAEKEEILDVTLDPNADADGQSYEQPIAERFGVRDRGRPADRWLLDTVTWAWRTRVLVHLGIDLRMRLWQAAEAEAVDVFAANLRDLLLAAPAGQRATMGLDPGFRTGVKVAVIDQTGKVTATHTIYPHVPQHKWDESLAILAHLATEHHVELIAIGNGTASRETDKLGDGPDRGQPWPEPHQDRRLRGRRECLLRQRVRQQRAPGTRRLTPWRGIHRAQAPGPPGRTGQDRPQVHRRRPVPARRDRLQAGTLPGRGRRGLRERGRGGRQYRVPPAALPRLRHH